MKKSFGEYTRLAKGPFGCSSLWAGDEHLLYVKGSGLIWPISETYRRVRYADITALTAAPSSGSIIWLALSGAWIFLSGAGVIATIFDTSDYAAPIAFGILALPGIIALVYNLIRGRTCIYAIETASGILKVRTANRLKIARRVSPAISKRIEES